MPGQRLLNRVAIITGASQGIGRETAKEFHREGALLVLADLRPSGAGEEIPTHEKITKDGGKAIFVKTDISSAADWKALIAKAVEEYGKLDM